MDKLFERDKLSKLKQEERDNMNNSISIKNIEFVVETFM